MSLYDHTTPSQQAAELALHVKRLRKRTALQIVPMLVVEGSTDELALSQLCGGRREHIFLGGDRKLVEQLLTHVKEMPVEGCECVFLVDCDGRGKTVRLAGAIELVVTQACDLEADLIKIGVVERLVRKFTGSDQDATTLMADGQALGMMLSTVRRAANAAGVSMKKNGWQLRLTELPEMHLSNWEGSEPADEDVLQVVSIELSWEQHEIEAVSAGLLTVRRSFDLSCLGKDALDAVYRLLLQRGQGEVRGWNRDYFYRAVFEAVEPSDIDSWEVGRRILSWQESTGCELLQTGR